MLAIDANMLPRARASIETDITFRMTAVYAAAIGAGEADYLDDAFPDGPMAPPPFTAALDWQLLIAPGYLAAFGLTRNDVHTRVLHAFQDTRFHAPIRPPMRLGTAVEVTSARAIPSGVLLTNRIRAVDLATGALVAESWFGSAPRLRAAADLAGPAEGSGRQPVSRLTAHLYGECANLWNPVHTEHRVAAEAGLPDTVLHGTYCWAVAAREIIRQRLDGDPLRLRRLGARFARPALPEGEIEIRWRDGTGPGTLDFVVAAADGGLLLSHGVAEFA